MTDYARNYLEFFGLDKYDPIEDPVNGLPAVDFHHLVARGMGGSKKRNGAWNLIPLTRDNHNQAERDQEFNERLKRIHFCNLVEHMASQLGITYTLTVDNVYSKGQD